VQRIIEPVRIRHALRHGQAGPNESVQTTLSCSHTVMTDQSDDRSACVAALVCNCIYGCAPFFSLSLNAVLPVLDAFPFGEQVLLLR